MTHPYWAGAPYVSNDHRYPKVTSGRHCRRFYSFESWAYTDMHARYLTLKREAIPRHRAEVSV